MRHMKKDNSAKRRFLFVVGLAFVVLAIALVSSRLHASLTKKDSADKPVTEALAESSFVVDKGIGDWLNGLTDEQLAELDIAFDAAVGEGFQGTREEWISKEVVAHYDSRGNMVVELPDGGEFTVSSHKEDNESGRAASEEGEASDNPSEKRIETESSDSKASESDKDEGENSVAVTPILSVDSVVVEEGTAEVYVPVRIRSNPGLLGLTLSVSYDEAALTLVDTENGDAFDGVLTMTRSRGLESGCLFTWDGIDLAPEDVRDGEILLLRFEVQKGAKGLHAVAVRPKGNAIGADLKAIAVAVEDGNVVVE